MRYFENGWYYLCGDDFTQENADVVCRENDGTTALSVTTVPITNITTSFLPILQKDFDCNGDEVTLCDCASEQATCSSDTVVQVQCNRPG